MAEATVLYFDPSGKFQRDDCWLIMKAGHINESNGDPHVWYSGQWHRLKKTIAVEYRRDQRTIEIIPKPPMPAAVTENLTFKANRLVFDKRSFRRVSGPDATYMQAQLPK